jgi:succinoglycan biosynthesis transport protein ExoP
MSFSGSMKNGPPAAVPPAAAPPAAAAPAAAPPLSLLVLVGALRRCWLRGGLLALVAAGAAALGIWLVVPPPKATARAMVHIAAKPEAILQGRPQDAGEFANFQKTQITVVKSQLVVKAALRDPQVAAALDVVRRQAAPVEWLMYELEVDFSMGPEVLRIALQGDDAESLKLVVNGVMKAYLEEFINNQEIKRKDRLEHLKQLRDKHEMALRAKRELLETFTPKLGTGDPKILAVWSEIKLTQLAAAKKELLEVQFELSKAERELQGLEKASAAALANVAISADDIEQQLHADSLYVKQVDRIAVLEEEIALVRKTAVNPETAEALLERRGKLAELEIATKVVQRRQQQQLPKITQRLREKARSDIEENARRAREQAFLNGEKQKVLNKIIADLTSETLVAGKESFDMLMARGDLEEEEKIVKAIAAEIRTLSTELLAPSRARALDDAVIVPASRDRRRLIVAAAAGAVALFLALFAVAWREWHLRRIHSAEDVAQGLGIRLVGTLPPLPRRLQRQPTRMGGDPADALRLGYGADSIDAFRTFLLHDAAAHSIRTVMVTSAVAGEGKTSLACQLAISLARAGRKTLLLDSDLRRSSIHHRFGLLPGPGLAELLRGEVSLFEATQPTSTPGLSVLVAGQGDAAAVQALAERIPDILEEARQSFDFILIDSAPVLSAPDALLVGQHADGVIFATLRGVSRIPLAAAAHHRITALGIPSLGAVVCGTREELYSFGYQPAA